VGNAIAAIKFCAKEVFHELIKEKKFQITFSCEDVMQRNLE
jgi:hypothetical protein